MPKRQIANFSKATLGSSLAASDTSLDLVAGQGVRFPVAPFDFIVWNETDFPDPADAYWSGAAEIMRVNPTSEGVPSILRAREATSALKFTDADKTYRGMHTLTADWAGNVPNVDLDSGNILCPGDFECRGGMLWYRGADQVIDAAGAITITHSYQRVSHDLGDGSTDNLDTINGGQDYQWLLLVLSNSARDVQLRSNEGNIRLDGGNDITLNSARDKILLFREASLWHQVSFTSNV